MRELDPGQTDKPTFGKLLSGYLDKTNSSREENANNLGLKGVNELEGILNGSRRPPRKMDFYMRLTEHLPGFSNTNLRNLLSAEGTPKVIISTRFRKISPDTPSTEIPPYIDLNTYTDEELDILYDQISACVKDARLHRKELLNDDELDDGESIL